MAQRIHSCDNNINLETIKCDAYSARLRNERVLPHQKSIHTRTRERSLSNNRMSNINSITAAKRTVALRQSSTLPNKQMDSNLLHKECYSDNNAMVEVTVKTHNGRPNSRVASSSPHSPKETWGKMLKSPRDSVTSSFTNFDPLRTVHFLAKELQCKLHNSLPHDKNVQQMILDMQQALSRVPADTSFKKNIPQNAAPKPKVDMQPTKLQIQSSNENVSKNIRILKAGTFDKYCQTPKELYVEPEKLQQHLEESSEKIAKACIQMEQLCSKLKAEKEELEIKLRNERNTVRVLQKQVEDDGLKYITANALVDSLQLKNEDLELELKTLQLKMDVNQGQSSEDLRKFVNELTKQKVNADEECMLLKQQITLANMETQKYEAILLARDSQIKEIRNEMTQLQEVVNEQLMELQNNTASTDNSTVSITTAQSSVSQGLETKTEALNEDMKDAISTKQLYPQNQHNILANGVTSGDTSTTSTDMPLRSKIGDCKSSKHIGHKKIHQKHSKGDSDLHSDTIHNYRDKFNDIKKQALACSARATKC